MLFFCLVRKRKKSSSGSTFDSCEIVHSKRRHPSPPPHCAENRCQPQSHGDCTFSITLVPGSEILELVLALKFSFSGSEPELTCYSFCRVFGTARSPTHFLKEKGYSWSCISARLILLSQMFLNTCT